MRQSFILQRAHVMSTDGPALMSEIVSYTGSSYEAASILRSLGRLGTDASIHYYDVTSTMVQRAYRGASPVVWNVRAVRG